LLQKIIAVAYVCDAIRGESIRALLQGRVAAVHLLTSTNA
jgi:hypothetical protein